MRRRASIGLAAFGVIAAVLLLLLLADGLGAGRTFGGPQNDLRGYFLMHLELVRAALLDGHLPLWNPYVFTGQPELASGQTGALYPIEAALLPVLGAELYAKVAILLHLWLMCLAGYFLARELLTARDETAHPAAAGLAGLAFGLSGFVASRVYAGHLTLLQTLPLLVLAMAAAANFIRTGSRRSGAVVAISLALAVLAGGPQLVPLVGLVAVPLLVTVPVRSGATRTSTVARLAALALAGLALSGAQLVPSLELAGRSVRAHVDLRESAALFALGPEHLPGLLLPGYTRTIQPYLTWEWSGFIGAPIVALAFVPLAVPRHRRVTLALLAAAALLLLAGSAPFAWLLTSVPGLSLLRVPARLLVGSVLLLPLLASLGLVLALSDPRARLAAGASLAVALAICALVDSQVQSDGALPTLLFTGLTAAAVLSRRVPTRVRPFAIAAAAAFPLVLGSAAFLRGAPERPTGPPEGLAATLAAMPSEARAISFFDDGWNTGMEDGYRNLGGYDPAVTYRAALLSMAMDTGDPASPFNHLYLQWPTVGRFVRSPLWERFGVRWVVSDAALPPPAGFVPTEREGGRVLSRGLADASRFSLISCALEVPGPVRALQLALERPNSSVLAVEGSADPSCESPRQLHGVRVALDEPEHIVVRVVAPCDAWLFVADLPYPGWRVTVDDEPRPLLTANAAGRAVRVSAGQHTVEMRFEPWSVVIGGAVSLLGLLGLIALCVLPRRSRA